MTTRRDFVEQWLLAGGVLGLSSNAIPSHKKEQEVLRAWHASQHQQHQ